MSFASFSTIPPKRHREHVQGERSDISSGTSLPVWYMPVTYPNRAAKEYPPLRSNIADADVVIVGAGIFGLTTAYMLGKEGKRVIILEDGTIASGESGRTSAHLTSEIDDLYTNVETLFGQDASRIVYESRKYAIDTIEAIIKSERINCDFQRLPGYLFPDPIQDTGVLKKELASANRAGFNAETVRVPFEGKPEGLIFPNQAQFHPLKYFDGLADAITSIGGRIYEHTHAKTMNGGITAKVTTADGYTVTAGHLVVASNTPVNDLVTMYTKMEPFRTYVIAAKLPAKKWNPGLYWDTAEPYHYVRTTPTTNPEELVLIVGGEDHKTGQESTEQNYEHHFSKLAAWAKKLWPDMGEIITSWSGQVIEPVDALGYYGRNPSSHNNVYIGTGDSGEGLTHATLGARIVTDLIMGRSNSWAKLYDPSRIPAGSKAKGEWLKANVNVARQYGAWLTHGDVEDIEDIKPGCGALIRRGMKKHAVYKDSDGTVCEMDATCPHLKAIVEWNPIEKTWDCPAHGSRFDRFGVVINGPANENLKRTK